MGLNVSDAYMDEIARLCSRQNMMNETSKFDETWTSQQLNILKRYKDPGVSFTVSPKITPGSDTSVLNQVAITFLDDCWRENVEAITGFKSYAEFSQAIRKEHAGK